MVSFSSVTTSKMGATISRSAPSKELPVRPLLPQRVKSIKSSWLEVPTFKMRRSPTFHTQPLDRSWSAQDPRTSSVQSLLPTGGESGKRTLLLIYIHGFRGKETTFKSFPAHVHNLVAILVAGTHVVHTKIYPAYRSRDKLESARDDFSHW